MVQYRKSKKVGPFRLTVSQRGISTSVGAGPVRISRGADGRVRRTVRIPGTGIYDTKVVGGQNPAPATAPAQVNTLVANLFVQLGKLFFYLFVLGFILSVVTGNLAVGFGIAGGIFVALLVYMAVQLAPLVFQIAGRKAATVGPRPQASKVHQRAGQASPEREPERTREELEADAQAAEAEAQAAQARARAIRLRIEAQDSAKSQGTAKPPPVQHNSEPPKGCRVPESPRKAAVTKPRNSPARPNGLRLGDRVRVVAPGDDYLKVGTVTRILDDGELT
jgi:hypothetical protein